jgi:hypothetical protein
VFAEAYTVLAIIVFHHCFFLSPRMPVRSGGFYMVDADTHKNRRRSYAKSSSESRMSTLVTVTIFPP